MWCRTAGTVRRTIMAGKKGSKKLRKGKKMESKKALTLAVKTISWSGGSGE